VAARAVKGALFLVPCIKLSIFSFCVVFFCVFFFMVFSIIQVGGSWSWVDADFEPKKNQMFLSYLFCLYFCTFLFQGALSIISYPTITCIFSLTLRHIYLSIFGNSRLCALICLFGSIAVKTSRFACLDS